MILYAHKVILRSLLAAIVVSAFLLMLTGCSSKAEKEPILVGHIAPFSGTDKAQGEHAKHGVVLAVEECNQEDRRIAGQKVAVLHVDSQGKSEIAQAEADRLITVNRVSGLLTLTPNYESDTLGRIVDSTGIALVVCNPVVPSSTESPLSVSLSPLQQGTALARFAQGEDLKAKRIAVIVDTRLGVATEAVAAFAKNWPKDADNALQQETYENKDRFAELANRIKKFKPDCIVFAGGAGDLSSWRTALKSGDIKAPLIFAGPETMLGAIQVEGETGPGIYFATSYVAGDEDTEEGKAFTKKYQERFHETPDLNAALAYDAAGLVFEAIKRSKANDSTTTKEALAKIESYPGLTGPFFIKDRVLRRTVYIAHFDGGIMKAVKKFKPDE